MRSGMVRALQAIFAAWCMWRMRQWCTKTRSIDVHQRASVQMRHERAPKVHQTCTNDAFGTFASAKSRVTMSSCRANVTRHLLRGTCYLLLE
jgi:hypothetical protein